MAYKKHITKNNAAESWAFGVIGGICKSYNINPVIPRIIFLISIFAWGLPLCAYVILAFFMKSESEVDDQNH